MRISVTVYGTQYTDDVEPRMLLVHYLRERLGKVGTVVAPFNPAMSAEVNTPRVTSPIWRSRVFLFHWVA